MFIRKSSSVIVFLASFSFLLVSVGSHQLDAATLITPQPIYFAPATGFFTASTPTIHSTAQAGVPNTGIAVPTPQTTVASSDGRAHLVIPAIALDDPIIPVGMDATGAMAVPSGSTDQVGWYKYGTQPGAIGSAVIDAHVFAAFNNLHGLAPGDNIYVIGADGRTLRFVVQSTQLYALADVPLQTIFAQNDAAHLNLITCAGNLTPDHSTYDHRLVVYAVLAS